MEAKRRRDSLIGARVETILQETGLRASQIADALGVSRSAISQTLNGGGMTPENVFKLADFTKYEARWIATGIGPKKTIDKPESSHQGDDSALFRGIGEYLGTLTSDKRLELLALLVAGGTQIAQQIKVVPGATNNENPQTASRHPKGVKRGN